MLLYEYPSKLEKAAQRRELALMTAKRKKLWLRNILMYLSAAAIVAIGVTADGIPAKIAICFLGLVIAGLCFITAQITAPGVGIEHTVITTEGFKHDTKVFLGKQMHFDILFSQIEKTQQNRSGDLVIELTDGKTVVVPFRVTKTKLYLIKNMSVQLKYPIREYNEFEDESEGKDWVDRL